MSVATLERTPTENLTLPREIAPNKHGHPRILLRDTSVKSWLDPQSGSLTPASHYRTILVIRPEGRWSIVHLQSIRKQGVSKNGKPWTRWMTGSIETFRLCRDGRVQRLTMSRRAGVRWTESHWVPIPKLDWLATQLGPNGSDLIRRHGLTEPRRADDLMPLFSYFGSFGVHSPAHIQRAMVGAPDLPTFTRNLFGVLRYRSDLVRAVAQSDLSTITVAHALRLVAPVDWIVQFLNSTRVENRWASNVGQIEKHLRNLDERSIRRLCLGQRAQMCDGAKVTLNGLGDLARFPVDPTVTRVESWADLHDRLARAQRDQLRREQIERLGGMTRDLTVQQKADVLRESISHVESSLVSAKLPDGYRITVPRTALDLVEWGDRLHNCIGGYAHAWNTGRSILGSVHHGEDLIGAFELVQPDSGNAWKIEQMLGKRNRGLEPEVRSAVEEAMMQAGVDVPQTYWGSR